MRVSTLFFCAFMASSVAVTTTAAAAQYPESEVSQPETVQPKFLHGKRIAAEAGARVMKEPYQVPGASGAAGDFVLQNEVLTVVIGKPSYAHGNAISGGYIIDAFLNDQPVDQLAQLHLYLNDKYPRMARFKEGRVVDPVPTGTASVVMTGVDSEDPSTEITTTYTLTSGSNAVEMRTAIMPRSQPVSNFPIGDAFAWGQAQQFIPGTGFGAVSGRVEAEWVGGAGKGVAYGLCAPKGTLWGPAASTWVDVSGTTASIDVGQTAEYFRYFIVGRDLADVSRVVHTVRGDERGVISGTVTEAESSRPADMARVTVKRGNDTVTQAVTRGGRFEVTLPPGSYTVSVSDQVRTAITEPQEIELPRDAGKKLSLRVASPAVAHLVVRDSKSGDLLPAKVTFVGEGETSSPDLGPAYERKARNIVDLPHGDERIPVPAGTYKIHVSRGIEYDLETHIVTLNRNRETLVETRLKHSAPMENYLSGDFHQHMKNSFDSAIPLEDRVISSVAEGLQLLVASDHNYVTDLSPVIKDLNLQKWIASIIGDEITTREFFFGHFNAFPLTPDAAKQGNGAVPYEKVTASQIFEAALAHPDEQVVQVNHPRAGSIGYFNSVNLSKEDGTTTHLNWSDRFTAIEIFNGKNIDEFETHVADWFNLLNLGYRFTGTGNSDSHIIYSQEPGYPRNYVRVIGKSPDSVKPADIVKGVNVDKNVLVTNGPLIDITGPNGASIGQTVKYAGGAVEFQVTVRGANFVKPNKLFFYGNGKLLKEVDIAETSDPLKWKGTLSDSPAVDTWYVVKVMGQQPLSPVVNPGMEQGKPVELRPAAITNPIWVDHNRDDKFIALNQEKLAMMQADRSKEALQNLDAMAEQTQRRPRANGSNATVTTATNSATTTATAPRRR